MFLQKQMQEEDIRHGGASDKGDDWSDRNSGVRICAIVYLFIYFINKDMWVMWVTNIVTWLEGRHLLWGQPSV